MPAISPPIPAGSCPDFGSDPAGAPLASVEPLSTCALRARPGPRPALGRGEERRRRGLGQRVVGEHLGESEQEHPGPEPEDREQDQRGQHAAGDQRALPQLDRGLARLDRASRRERVGVRRQVGPGRGRDDLHRTVDLAAGDHPRPAQVEQHRNAGAGVHPQLLWGERRLRRTIDVRGLEGDVDRQVSVVLDLEHEAAGSTRAHDARCGRERHGRAGRNVEIDVEELRRKSRAVRDDLDGDRVSTGRVGGRNRERDAQLSVRRGEQRQHRRRRGHALDGQSDDVGADAVDDLARVDHVDDDRRRRAGVGGDDAVLGSGAHLTSTTRYKTISRRPRSPPPAGSPVRDSGATRVHQCSYCSTARRRPPKTPCARVVTRSWTATGYVYSAYLKLWIAKYSTFAGSTKPDTSGTRGDAGSGRSAACTAGCLDRLARNRTGHRLDALHGRRLLLPVVAIGRDRRFDSE